MADQKKFLDYEGIKHLWSKINMQDYPNNEMLMAVINAIDETKANKEDLTQSDWNENDETSLAYIKNKPEIASDDDIIKMLAELDMIAAVADSDNAMLADENENILLW